MTETFLGLTSTGPSPTMGASLASNVRVKFSDNFVATVPISGSHAELYTEYLLKKYSASIHSWGPGQKESNSWLWGEERTKDVAGIPRDVDQQMKQVIAQLGSIGTPLKSGDDL